MKKSKSTPQEKQVLDWVDYLHTVYGDEVDAEEEDLQSPEAVDQAIVKLHSSNRFKNSL